MTSATQARVRLALVIGVFASAIAAGGWVLGRGFREREATPSARLGAQLFDDVFAHIMDHYVDSLDAGSLYTRAAAGVVGELNDPHSVFLDSTRLALVQARVSGMVGSLGLEVDARNGWVNVVVASQGAPAEQAGVRMGDRIVAIDGRSTRNWTNEEARRALRGSPGTSVRVTVERLGMTGRAELTIEREAVYNRPVQRAMIVAGDIGYVKLSTFSDSAALELASAIDSLHKQGMRALILDLRGNPGGLLAQGTAVADLFLNPGQGIVSLRGRGPEGRRDYVDERPQQWNDVRLSVLVDRGSASASEIVAGALQDHDRAIVIGRPTYGKGSAQHIFSFHEQAGVKLTTARWYTPSGRNIEYVEASAPDGRDATGGDSASRPAFKTDSGRTVYGGGGIVPDIVAGDLVNAPPPTRRLLAALGANVRKLRAAIVAEAKVLATAGISDPLFDVSPATRDAVYARLARSGVRIDRRVFDGGSEWVDRQIGSETALVAFGVPAQLRRLTVRDKVVQEAVSKLRAARSTAELIRGVEPRNE